MSNVVPKAMTYNTLCSGITFNKVVPYQRQTQRQRVDRYARSMAALGADLIQTYHDTHGLRYPCIQEPFYIWLVVTIEPTNDSASTGVS